MKRFLLSIAILAFAGLGTEPANAKNGNSNNSNKNVTPVNFQPSKTVTGTAKGGQTKTGQGTTQNLKPKYTGKDYNLKFGKKYDFGWCYKGKHHDHWSHCCWFGQYGCNCYWCPCTLCWYYYCVPDNCWYPVTYCPYGVYVW